MKSPRVIDIKSYQLFILGLVMILLGTYVVANYLSQIAGGILVILGAGFWIVALIKFTFDTIKLRKRPIVKWLRTTIVAVILLGGGVSAYGYYQSSLNDKIYSVNQTTSLPGLDFKVTKADSSDVKFAEPDAKVKLYGDIMTPEDCTKYPFFVQNPNTFLTGNYVSNDDWEKSNHSGKYCEWRNDSRKNITSYEQSNKRLTIAYELAAHTNIDSSRVHITVLPDSGRDPKEPAKQFNYDSLLSNNFTPAFNYTYTPYDATNLGGDINNDIVRRGTINTDIRNDEKSIDVKVSYSQGKITSVRIVRIQRQ